MDNGNATDVIQADGNIVVSGQVAIGTATPNATAKLQVQGQTRIVSDGTNSPLVVRDSTDTSTILEMDNNNLNINGTFKYLKFNDRKTKTFIIFLKSKLKIQ
ncbi:MAG: hypothetical protein HGA25_08580, partial [Clostridiales bacterium]|nr:hypothetical protein [Clostridiales bacterium]